MRGLLGKRLPKEFRQEKCYGSSARLGGQGIEAVGALNRTDPEEALRPFAVHAAGIEQGEGVVFGPFSARPAGLSHAHPQRDHAQGPAERPDNVAVIPVSRGR